METDQPTRQHENQVVGWASSRPSREILIVILAAAVLFAGVVYVGDRVAAGPPSEFKGVTPREAALMDEARWERVGGGGHVRTTCDHGHRIYRGGYGLVVLRDDCKEDTP
jgi:hypothetical protein